MNTFHRVNKSNKQTKTNKQNKNLLSFFWLRHYSLLNSSFIYRPWYVTMSVEKQTMKTLLIFSFIIYTIWARDRYMNLKHQADQFCADRCCSCVYQNGFSVVSHFVGQQPACNPRPWHCLWLLTNYYSPIPFIVVSNWWLWSFHWRSYQCDRCRWWTVGGSPWLPPCGSGHASCWMTEGTFTINLSLIIMNSNAIFINQSTCK